MSIIVSAVVTVLFVVYLIMYEPTALWIPWPLIGGTLGIIIAYSYVFLVKERRRPHINNHQ